MSIDNCVQQKDCQRLQSNCVCLEAPKPQDLIAFCFCSCQKSPHVSSKEFNIFSSHTGIQKLERNGSAFPKA